MTPEILLRYTNFKYLANDILLSIVEKQTTTETLDREIISSFPSIRKTINHIWGAEYIRLKRLLGETTKDWPGKTFSGTVSELKEQILSNDKDFISYVEKLDVDKLLTIFNYNTLNRGKPHSNPIWESVLHCMNHSTYHRGQIVTLLRQTGVLRMQLDGFYHVLQI